MFSGPKRLLFLGIVVGWLLAIVVDQVIGYDYQLTHSSGVSATTAQRMAQSQIAQGWELVSGSQETGYYLRRQRWMGWVDKLQR